MVDFFDKLYSNLISEQYRKIELLENKVRNLEEENSKLKKLVENGRSAIDTSKRLCDIIFDLLKQEMGE